MKIDNRLISSSISDILISIREASNGKYFSQIKSVNDYIMTNCPFHKDGQERHPSFGIKDDDKLGYCHCFACGKVCDIIELVSYCLSLTNQEAKQWLIEKHSDIYIVHQDILPEIILNKKNDQYLDESVLNEYAYYNDYMFKRGLTEEIINKFKIGSTKDGQYITFTVWDRQGRLVGITKRSTSGKQYIIPENFSKPVYLLNYIIKDSITDVVICESQINALRCWVNRVPAVALFGTGSKQQYDILKTSGIRHYYLGFDGDLAGRHGIIRFIQNMPKDTIIDIMLIPEGKDIADLSKEEFNSLQIIDKNDWLKNFQKIV